MGKRRYDGEPSVNPEVALPIFKKIIKKFYKEYNLSLPDKVYLSDSRVEEGLPFRGKSRVRVHANSDIDILVPEPENLNPFDLSSLEKKIRDEVNVSGVDFNFAPKKALEAGDAYDRPCELIENFRW